MQEKLGNLFEVVMRPEPKEVDLYRLEVIAYKEASDLEKRVNSQLQWWWTEHFGYHTMEEGLNEYKAKMVDQLKKYASYTKKEI